MKGTTKPKGFGIAAAGLLAALLIAAAILPAMAGEDSSSEYPYFRIHLYSIKHSRLTQQMR
jgi:hypothetical protein